MVVNKFPVLLFVYGTLQRAYGNHRVLAGDSGKHAEFVGRATTMPKFYMTGSGFPRVAKTVLGGFPPNVDRTDYFAPVGGEVWRATKASFEACDRLESHPVFYKREQVPVMLTDKTRLLPWMYVIVQPPRAYECVAKNDSGILQWAPGQQSRMIG